MKVLAISDTIIDLDAQTAPFLPGYTVLVVNLSAASISLDQSDVGNSTDFEDEELVDVAAASIEEVTLDKRYLLAAGATGATLYLVGN
jgi:hypothetical protein